MNKEKIIWTPGLLNIILLHFVICFVASSCLFLSTSIAEGCHDIDQLPYMREDGCFHVVFVCKLTTNLFFSDLSHWQLKVLWKRILYVILFSFHLQSKWYQSRSGWKHPLLPAGSGSPCCPRCWRGGDLAPGSVKVCGGRGSGSQALVSPQLLRDSVMCDVWHPGSGGAGGGVTL